MNDIELKLDQLRDRWKKEPQNRSVIELEAKILRMGLKSPKHIETEDPFIKMVKKTLK